LLLLMAGAASAQQFPELGGRRVVDEANMLTPQQEAELTNKLQALEQASSRQLVIATVPTLQDRPIEDYGYQLGRHWGIGQSKANNGTILLVAPSERKVRIEVGYGLEPILTDAFSNRIIDESILPRFRAGDMAGGIVAGTDAIIHQLQAPPEEAEQRALEAAKAKQGKARGSGGGGSIFPLFFWGVVLAVILFSMIGRGSRRFGGYRGRSYGGSSWPIILWTVANEIERSSRGRRSGGWGGGFGGGSSGGFGGFGGGGGGFSGGGGSFGGGGASGSW
jgi:uncharacterized protein